MKASHRKAARMVMDRAPKPRMHFFWWEPDETAAMVDARIDARIASGEASENDRFVVFSWTRPEEDGPHDGPRPRGFCSKLEIFPASSTLLSSQASVPIERST